MSAAVVVYSVKPGDLQTALGSKDGALKRAMRLGSDNRSRAVLDLIDGAPLQQSAETVVHAFELLCGHLGRALPSASFSPNTDMLKRIDAVLAAEGLPVSLLSLIYGGAPVPLPPTTDYPTVGSLSAANVQLAGQALAEHPLASDDLSEDAALFDVSEWIHVAAARGDMLVGFSY